jgi:hypothetical protein
MAVSPVFSQSLAAAGRDANCSSGDAATDPAIPVIPAIKKRLVIIANLK